MTNFKTEGIVIHALPFRNSDCILTVFTPLDGLIKLFFRGAYNAKKGNIGATAPLSVVEIVYAKGRSDLYPCIEIMVTNSHLALRQNFSVLEAACELLQSVAMTQQPEKSAPELYQLLLRYLSRLPDIAAPQIITTSFRLKLMRYEGVLAFLSHCSICGETLKDAWIQSNEAFCSSHQPEKAIFLTKEERNLVEHLTFCRDLTLIANLSMPSLLAEKICHLFTENFH